MEAWAYIRRLEGETLKTLDRKNPFDVVKVYEANLIVVPHISRKQRKIAREVIENVVSDLKTHGMITRAEIRERHSDFNPAYIAAVIAEFPNVEFTLRPITLRYRPW